MLTLLPGEARVLAEFLQGVTRQEVATVLKMAPRTVDTHMTRVLAKCGCTSIQLLRICCHDLADDGEVFDALGLKAAMYPARIGNPKIAGIGVT
jgi:DNA-binding NarL/FixJ family response regulator